MIGAGLVLLSLGGADLITRRLRGRTGAVALIGLAVLTLLLAIGADAAAWWVVSAAVTALWMLTTGAGRFGLWPAAIVGGVCLLSVSVVGIRPAQGALGEIWPADSPLGAVSLDAAVGILGAAVFLSESGNVIVRAALRGGAVGDAATLKGGRLIGPLERILVFALTLTGAFTLLAAVLAAKGIVRFPEISRDDVGGERAEYFLVGSLVSWVTALGAAFLVWWAMSV